MASKTGKTSGAAVAWAFVLAFALLLVRVIIWGWIIKLVWNSLTTVTHLPEITFSNGVSAFILMLAIGAGLGLSQKGS